MSPKRFQPQAPSSPLGAILTPLLLAGLGSISLAQGGRAGDLESDPRIAFPSVSEPGVLYDRPAGEGTALWARGTNYKACFDRSGTRFIPALGPEAPRNFSLGLRLDSVWVDGAPVSFAADVPAQRVGEDVIFDRGTLTELYAMQSGSMEQMFVFDDLPRTGALTIRMRVETDLEASEGVGGLTFSNSLGGVSYSSAIAVGARGEQRSGRTRCMGQEIEIHIDREDVEQLAFPLVIDPVISAFAVDGSAQDDRNPDQAYMAVNDRWCVVWERSFSFTDHDVLTCFIDSTGAVVPGTTEVVDITDVNWRFPKVAYNGNSEVVMIVAEEGDEGDRRIYGRIRGTGPIGPTLLISDNSGGESLHPDVGGDPRMGGLTSFCVVWQYAAPSNGRILSQLMRADGIMVGGTTPISPSDGENRAPAIANSSGPPSARGWNVVWTRITNPDGVTESTTFRPTLRRVDELGLPATTYKTLHQSASPVSNVTVSTSLETTDGDQRFLVVWESDQGGGQRIEGMVIRGITGVAPTTGVMDISSILGAAAGAQHRAPSVDCDGATFVVGYSSVTSTFPLIDHDVFVASLTLVGDTLIPNEGPDPLQQSGMVDRDVSIVARHSGGGAGQDFLATWTDGQLDFSGNVAGAFYRTQGVGVAYCVGGLNSDGMQASIRATGALSLGAPGGGITLKATDCPANKPGLFFYGMNQIQLPFGEGFRCAGGQVQRVYPLAHTNGSGVAQRQLTYSSEFGDLLFPGAPGINYQYWYRDPTGGPAGFNLTDALHIEHTP